jgi:hypothetical protein
MNFQLTPNSFPMAIRIQICRCNVIQAVAAHVAISHGASLQCIGVALAPSSQLMRNDLLPPPLLQPGPRCKKLQVGMIDITHPSVLHAELHLFFLDKRRSIRKAARIVRLFQRLTSAAPKAEVADSVQAPAVCDSIDLRSTEREDVHRLPSSNRCSEHPDDLLALVGVGKLLRLSQLQRRPAMTVDFLSSSASVQAASSRARS